MGKLPLSRRGTAIAGIALAAVLAAGGSTAYAVTSGSSTHAKATGSSTSKSKTKAKSKARARARAERRIAARSVHGSVTVKKGTSFVTREWQRGEVTAVSGTTLTVKSKDGTTWTWRADPKLKVTRDGKKAAESVIKSGDTVAIAGRVSGSSNDAVRIHAPSAAKTAKAAS
jgi:hypothetical protein